MAFGDRLCVLITFVFVGLFQCVQCQSYANSKAIFDNVLSSSVYNTETRPLNDQSQVVHVGAIFELVSIVEVDDVHQSLQCNGFAGFQWVDEVAAWDPLSYGMVSVVHPLPRQIWRPRVVLMNTLNKRDIFEDDHAPILLFYNGSAFYWPGSLFTTSCDLDMTNYPFDVHTCDIQLMSMHTMNEVLFYTTSPKVSLNFFTPNGEWELVDTNSSEYIVDAKMDLLSAMRFSFTLKRRPTFMLLNIVLPVVFLSFLNLLVFIIPVDSGEKISYGITVLLALAVFMSIVSSMLPRTSQAMPTVTIYLFVLLVISVLTVIDAIVIVFLHHLEERENKHMRARDNFTSAVTKIRNIRTATTLFRENSKPESHNTTMPPQNNTQDHRCQISAGSDGLPPYSERGGERSLEKEKTNSERRVNRYKVIGKYIDMVSLVVFTVIWFGVTFGLLLTVSL